MNNFEKKQKERKLKIDAFKVELKELMQRHNFKVIESDNYDGEEGYCGSDYHLFFDGETYWEETITDMLGDFH